MNLHARSAPSAREVRGVSEAARWLQDEERHVNYRADYLVRTTPLGERRARVLALRELGYSSSGIARRVEQTESTVRTYLEEAAVRFGQRGVETRHPDAIAVDAPVETVTPDDVLDYPAETRRWWRRLAEKYPACAPAWFDADGFSGGDA